MSLDLSMWNILLTQFLLILQVKTVCTIWVQINIIIFLFMKIINAVCSFKQALFKNKIKDRIKPNMVINGWNSFNIYTEFTIYETNLTQHR